MQHSIKNLWLYPFPEIDVVHTQEPLLPEQSEEHTSELQSRIRISYAVFCLKKKRVQYTTHWNSPASRLL